MSIRQVLNSWLAWRRLRTMERAYPPLAELNQMIRDAQRRHEPIAHLYAARVRFLAEKSGRTA